MQLSEHFSLEEMTASQEATRKGIDNTAPPAIVKNLTSACLQAEAVRTLLGAPMSISSGYRCPQLNSMLGGAQDSAHMQGWAMDFICPSIGTPLELCLKIADSGIKFDQLINEGAHATSLGWVHISFAPAMRQQCLTARFTAAGATYEDGLVA